jgi:glycyl-tRNA synthetase
MVDCKSCKQRFRADDLTGNRCPECGGELTQARQFNLMFRTFMGPVEDTASTIYLRPETAQGIFANFANILDTQRVKLPFGVAQTGKSFRNEITPGNFIFRTREFEQMEMEFFIRPDPEEEARWFEYWVNERFNWYARYGIKPGHLKLRPHAKDELSHYSRGTTDIEYLYPFGWGELEGIAKRGSFDLDQHAKFSGKDLTYFDEEAKARYRPWVIEPAAGVDRTMLAFLLDAYDEDVVENEERIVLRLDPRLAPTKVAVYPLLRKGGQPEKAQKVREILQRYFTVAYDQAGSIGRRYRRQDEVGTPYGVTIDHQTMEDDTVTLRDRDSTKQDRVAISALAATLIERIGWYR